MMIAVKPHVPRAPALPKHPGTIEMVNADTGETKQEDAARVPQSVAFIDGVPVVKVVSRALHDGGREAVSYAADGRALRAQTFVKRT